MQPFSKILVPTDFSQHSEQALPVAADLARRYDAPITLLHVYEAVLHAVPESYLLYSTQHLPELLKALEHQLEKQQALLRAMEVKNVEIKMLEGAPFVEIVGFARSESFDLIVMGTHGHTGFQHMLLGSVAERVVRKAPCAVLTVRKQDPAKAA